MNQVLRVIVALPAILFVVTGLRWLVAPEPVAAEFGMPLLDGVGRSSQIGDMSAFFLTLGRSATRPSAWRSMPLWWKLWITVCAIVNSSAPRAANARRQVSPWTWLYENNLMRKRHRDV